MSHATRIEFRTSRPLGYKGNWGRRTIIDLNNYGHVQQDPLQQACQWYYRNRGHRTPDEPRWNPPPDNWDGYWYVYLTDPEQALRWIAQLYRDNADTGRLHETIQKTIGQTEHHVTKMITEARKDGLIGPPPESWKIATAHRVAYGYTKTLSTHCRRGHQLVEGNVYPGNRCRRCSLDTGKAYQARKKAA